MPFADTRYCRWTIAFNHQQLQSHLTDFINAYNYGRRLKTLKGLTPYEFIAKMWTTEPERFRLNPIHQMPGLNRYDGDGFRAEIVDRGAKPIIPNKSNWITLHSFSRRAYKGRNVIERCFCRLKDFRRVATRYDKLARNFLAAVHLAAIVAYWIN